MTTAFSVLLPVYRGDDAQHFVKALSSAGDEQTLAPAEIVVVEDGPLPPGLADAVSAAAAASRVPVRRLVLPENVGLARALTAGLAACEHDVVARMDADDISLPERFARQLPLMADHDLVGTGMFEFDAGGRILGSRTPPVGRGAISRAARLRDPFNHPTVVYRRSVVRAVGGYRHLPLMEDYWLFARMIQHGARCANLPDPLVMYRVDAGAYRRRGGGRLFASELALQRSLRRDGFTTTAQAARNVAVRGGYRFVPTPVRRLAYRAAMVRSGASKGAG